MSKGITIKIAHGGEIQDFKKFLFKTYCLDLGWHDPAKFPKGIFADEHDAVSVFLLVYDGPHLISGVRLVADSEKGFPHESVSGISLPNICSVAVEARIQQAVKNAGRKRIMEVTRFIGTPSVKRLQTLDLMKAMYWFGIYNDKEVYFMAVDMNAFLLCRKLKFPIIPIGVPIFCEGSWTIPAVMLVSEMISSLENDKREYILDTANLIGKWQVSRKI